MTRSLRSWLWRVPLHQEVDEELAFHLEMRTRELIREGMDPAEARRTALSRLGDLAVLRRTCLDEGRKRDRTMRFTRWLDELRDDVRFGLRQLACAPAFAIVAAVTLALGIGVNSAIFALADATLLRPLPFPAPQRLVMALETSETAAHEGVSPLNLSDWRERSHTMADMAGFIPYVGSMVMAGADGTAETVPRQWVTAGVFRVLGLTPVVGRTMLPEDEQQRRNVVVLSESFWRSRFGGDPSVVGTALRLDGDPFTVVGVVPDQARLIGDSSLWALRSYTPRPAMRGAHFLKVVARLKPGIALAAAGADLSAVAEGLAREYPETNAGRGAAIEPLHDALIGRDLRVTSVLFLGVVGFVLLICCANVANLLMARATVRARELAIRAALGAGRRRIFRQLLTESLLLSVIGGTLGMAVGAAILAVAPSVIPAGILPPAVSLSFDLRVLGFSVVAALVVGILFGLAPAWQSDDLAAAARLTAEGRTSTSRSGALRSVLVAGEVATAVLLLCGAGLLLRTLIAVDNVDRGYRASGVLTMMVDPLGSQFTTPESLLQFFEAIDRELAAIPGVRSAAWTSTLPMGESVFGDMPVEIVDGPPRTESQRPLADVAVVSASYFEALELPIVKGRAFDHRDTLQSPGVCIVNEAFARNYLGGRSPIGARVALRPSETSEEKREIVEVVGVARQVRSRPDEREPFLQVYVPLAQSPVDDLFLTIRPESGPAEALTGPVRAAIGRVDKAQLVSVRDVITLDDVVWDATGRHRFRAVMVGAFAALALLLAMVGVFGILAYSVQQRARDLAVRRALGATTGDVLRLVASGAFRVIALGGVAGLVLAVALGRLVTTMLFGVTPLDPVTFGAVGGVLALTAAASIAGPAWRAAHIDPAAVLRDS